MNKQPHTGQPVLYFPAKAFKTADSQSTALKEVDPDKDVKSNNNEEGPVAAIVTRVFGKGPELPCINLTVFPDQGTPVCRSSVAHDSNKGDGQASWRYTDEV